MPSSTGHMTGTSHLAELVSFVCGWQPSDDEREAARLRLFDASLSAVAARASSDGTVERLAAALFGAGRERLGPAWKLFEFASIGRSSEVDDLHLASCSSPGMIVVPTVVALCSLVPERDARHILDVVAKGYEAVTRAAAALGGPALLSDGIWPSLVVAPVGAALTASALLGLDEGSTLEAVGLACGACFDGGVPDPGRRLQFGSAVLAGASAAVAAHSGCAKGAAPPPDWFARSTRGRLSDPTPGHKDAGSAVVTTIFKPFCGARQGLAAIAGVLAIAAREGVSPDDVTHVLIGVPSPNVRMLDRARVTSRLDSIASIQYQVALALLAPGELYDLRRVPLRSDALHADVMKRVTVAAEPTLDADFPEHWGARVELRAGDRLFVEVLDGVPGEMERSWDVLRDKAARLLARAGVAPLVGEELRALASSFGRAREISGLYEPEVDESSKW